MKKLKSWRIWPREHRFTILLCGLALMIFVSPITRVLRAGPPSLFSRLFVVACFILMLLSALFAISQSRQQWIAAAILAIPTVVLQSLHAVRPNDQVSAWGYAMTTLFLGYIVVLVIQALFAQRTITVDIICASLCAYLLLGLCWAFMYVLVEYHLPGSFSISDVHLVKTPELTMGGIHNGFAMYHSFVTLSTLGYGDVIPVNPISRALCYSEAVLGQIYLAVLVARLVGLQISQSIEETK